LVIEVKRQQSEEQASTMGAYLSTPTIKRNENCLFVVFAET
jgi:hypothetical protein